jgi:hypothetical protein
MAMVKRCTADPFGRRVLVRQEGNWKGRAGARLMEIGLSGIRIPLVQVIRRRLCVRPRGVYPSGDSARPGFWTGSTKERLRGGPRLTAAPLGSGPLSTQATAQCLRWCSSAQARICSSVYGGLWGFFLRVRTGSLPKGLDDAIQVRTQ